MTPDNLPEYAETSFALLTASLFTSTIALAHPTSPNLPPGAFEP